MHVRRLTMDLDFHDMAYISRGSRAELEELFDSMAAAGFHATIMDCCWCGTALYHSNLLPVFTNRGGFASAQRLAAILRERDPLAEAIHLGRQRNIQVLAYFRMLEEAYAPFDGHEFFARHPEYWWQSRCGMYRLVGWPCYNYPEVREHMLTRVDDLVEHGVDGFLFGLARTHIPYFNAERQNAAGETFGYNPPVVAEFKRRYGVDLSRFDHIEDAETADHRGLPFVYEHRWVGTEPYDVWAFRRLLGEGFDAFLRAVRARHPQTYIAIECGYLGAGGREDEPAGETVFRIDLERLCAEGVINEYAQSRNYRQDESIDAMFLPRFQHVRDSGAQLTGWLNDLFTATGGGGAHSTVADVAAYVDRFLASRLDGALVHEAAFLYECDDPAGMWQQLHRLGPGPH
jgi:hypothetical protein